MSRSNTRSFKIEQRGDLETSKVFEFEFNITMGTIYWYIDFSWGAISLFLHMQWHSNQTRWGERYATEWWFHACIRRKAELKNEPGKIGERSDRETGKITGLMGKHAGDFGGNMWCRLMLSGVGALSEFNLLDRTNMWAEESSVDLSHYSSLIFSTSPLDNTLKFSFTPKAN